MNDAGFSTDERRRIRLARCAIYVFPLLAGLLTVCVSVVIQVFRIPAGLSVGNYILFGNALLAGVASACVVARLHVVQRGKLWRAGSSFLFSFVLALVAVRFWVEAAGWADVFRILE